MAASDAPTESTTVYAGRVLSGVREATPAAIDPTRYRPIGDNESRRYLVAIARTEDPVAWSHQDTALYVSADGTRLTTRRFGDHPTPHAISAPISAGAHTDRLLGDDAPAALAALVANAHPEVQR